MKLFETDHVANELNTFGLSLSHPSQPLIWRSVSGMEENFPQSEILIVNQMFFQTFFWASGFGTCQNDSSSRPHPYTHFSLAQKGIFFLLLLFIWWLLYLVLYLFIVLYLDFYFESSLCLWHSTTNDLTQFKVSEEAPGSHHYLECVE